MAFRLKAEQDSTRCKQNQQPCSKPEMLTQIFLYHVVFNRFRLKPAASGAGQKTGTKTIDHSDKICTVSLLRERPTKAFSEPKKAIHFKSYRHLIDKGYRLQPTVSVIS
jgi:hypothetical protein